MVKQYVFLYYYLRGQDKIKCYSNLVFSEHGTIKVNIISNAKDKKN